MTMFIGVAFNNSSHKKSIGLHTAGFLLQHFSPSNPQTRRHQNKANTMKIQSTLLHNRVVILLLLLLLAISFIGPGITAQSIGVWYETQDLVASDVDPGGDYYAAAVAIEQDNIILVSAISDDLDRSDLFEPGSVFVFEQQESSGSWVETQQLFGSDSVSYSRFGHSLAVEGDWIVVGNHDGIAYIFKRGDDTQWIETQKFSSPILSDDAASFTSSVDLSGGLIAVGEDNQDGAVHVYSYNDESSNWEFETTILPIEGSSTGGSAFGKSVALDGNTLVVGAPDAGESGAAYVFLRSDEGTWDNGRMLTPPSTAGDTTFGFSVAVENGLIVVGHSGYSSLPYVFQQEGSTNDWTYMQALPIYFSETVSISGDRIITSGGIFARIGVGGWAEMNVDAYRYGSLVAIDGNTVVKGDLFDHSAFVLVEADESPTASPTLSISPSYSPVAPIISWDTQQEITENDLPASCEGAGLGDAIDIDMSTLILGNYNLDIDGIIDKGGAHVFERNGDGVWSWQQTITSSEVQGGSWFGDDVAIGGNWLVVAAKFEDNNGAYGNGAVYVFQRDQSDTFVEVQKLVAIEGQTNYLFGQSIAIDNNTIVVGEEGGGDSHHGAAYVYVLDDEQWTLQQKLIASDAEPGDEFGFTVSISGDTVIVGAPNEDSSGDTSGSAYVFTRSGSTWDGGKKLAIEHLSPGDKFGYSVAVHNENIVVGSGESSRTEGNAVFAFKKGSDGLWVQQQTLEGGGTNVALDGSRLLTLGKTYAMIDDRWLEQEPLVARGGDRLALSGATAVQGGFVSEIIVSVDSSAGKIATLGSPSPTDQTNDPVPTSLAPMTPTKTQPTVAPIMQLANQPTAGPTVVAGDATESPGASGIREIDTSGSPPCAESLYAALFVVSVVSLLLVS